MSRKVLLALAAVALFVGILLMTARSAQPPTYRHDPLNGLVYFQHPTTKQLMLYVSFELEPNREYDVQITADGVPWSDPWRKSTKGAVNDEYYSFNVDPCGGLWPRVIDRGPSPP